jgi:HAAS
MSDRPGERGETTGRREAAADRRDDSPIEQYLDRLLGELRADPHRARRILAEAEDHLYSTAARLERAGADRDAAEIEAVRHFGRPSEVAASHGGLRLRDLVRPATGLAAVGLLAIGVSGLVVEAMGRVWGANFVSGDLPGSSYTPARCADFQEYFPGRECLAAAALHHWGEVVEYRVAAGVLGLLLLLAYRFLPKRRPLPGGAATALGAILFLAAAAVLSLDSLNAATQGGHGVGASLSAAIVAAVAGLTMLVRAWRAHRPTRPREPAAEAST